jgi:hypothetical protein
MANFDVSFLNSKLKKSTGDYGFLVDQLSIKENQLASDGKLSPGDYDLLVGEAQKVYAHPGLTPDQRSNIKVKISAWDQGKKVNSLKDSQNLTKLNNEVKDDNIKNSMILAKNPSVFLQASVASTRAKLNSLSESINNLQSAGDDASSHLLEYEKTLNDYNDLLQAQSDVTEYQKAPSGKPTSAFAAYVNTNTKGEVTGISIEKAGSRTGYAETNGLYGGLPIYGNAKLQNGKQTFKIGDQSFSAANILVPDPQNPGSFKNNKLVSESSQTNLGMGRTKATAGGYTDINLETIRSQTVVPVDSYVKGNKGFIYQAKSDGTYKKIVNSTPEKLGIDINDLPSIPRDYENNLIIPRVSETVDESMAPELPMPQVGASSVSYQPTQTTTPTAQVSAGQPNTKAPTERAPKSTQGLAESTFNKAKSFFGGLFGGK